MDYTKVPSALLYKKNSLDKLAMQHPLNATVIKKLLKMEGWNKLSSIEGSIFQCMNNAYYICTIMRLEYDATFREESYKRIARENYIEGNNTLVECVTLSLVAILVEHSTPKWRQKLQEVADDLLLYAGELIEEREVRVNFTGSKQTKVVHLIGIHPYLSDGVDNSWILPDIFFQPRTVDAKAIFDQHRQDPTFNWEKTLYRYDDDDIREVIENLGKTQLEKALLLRSIWKDVYYSRKEYDGPVKGTWLLLKTLAQEFCPDCMETTELDKIPSTGIEFEKRISELEEEVKNIKQENVNLIDHLKEKDKRNVELEERFDSTEEKDNEWLQQAEKLRRAIQEIQKLKEDRTNLLAAFLKPAFYNDEKDARDFLKEIAGKDNQGVTDVARKWLHDGKITPSKKGRFIWDILRVAKLYDATEQNWTAAMRKKD